MQAGYFKDILKDEARVLIEEIHAFAKAEGKWVSVTDKEWDDLPFEEQKKDRKKKEERWGSSPALKKLANTKKRYLIRMDSGAGLTRLCELIWEAMAECDWAFLQKYREIIEEEYYDDVFYSDGGNKKYAFYRRLFHKPDFLESRIFVINLNEISHAPPEAASLARLEMELNLYSKRITDHEGIIVFALRYGDEEEFEKYRDLISAYCPNLRSVFVPSYSNDELWEYAGSYLKDVYNFEEDQYEHVKEVFCRRMDALRDRQCFHSLKTVQQMCDRMAYEWISNKNVKKGEETFFREFVGRKPSTGIRELLSG